MNEISLSPVWVADLGDGKYRNPILHADYSDLDIIRVGDSFYMTASSFVSTPGLPILESKDLVNWTIIGHAVDRLPSGYDESVRHAQGIWAPSIRYHDGMFWIFVSTPDEGVFMTQAKEASGPWSELHLVKEVKGWIDPCPMWDEDGQAYLIHAYAYSRCGFNSKLNLCKMKSDGTALLDDGVVVFDGTDKHPTIEGPKLYKRNGYYYIFAPAGGVATGWQTVLRSRNIFGPFEDRIVMHQGDTQINGPHQGGYVELDSGESWFAHFQDSGAYGRIVHLQPMTWQDDWPIIGEDTNGDGIGEPVMFHNKPNVGPHSWPITVPNTSDHFETSSLGLQWQWQGNKKAEWYSFDVSPGNLRLYANTHHANFFETPNILCQKFPAPVFTATTKLNLESRERAFFQSGMTVFGHEFAYMAVEQSGFNKRMVVVEGNRNDVEKLTASFELENSLSSVYIQVHVAAGALCTFHFSLDGIEYQQIGDPFVAKPGGWVGAKIGLFCSPIGYESENDFVDFEWISIKE
ncbi:glycoside hydrolase 43 family protein [Paenibacillus sp. HWE-109]|uniref:glycoside hydrolase family 43 protein n=1 Tax=Paenibacillus sp. HWE-109 TaxID=1306526 RepID=UPI001EE0C5B7|nr:glycoside hydrolase 43 family protein [Paenibacillus sp. HWE-109]UKS28234.1 glycoside hydrolase 43 family protein [Paenibacillus sp. HWE-109]